MEIIFQIGAALYVLLLSLGYAWLFVMLCHQIADSFKSTSVELASAVQLKATQAAIAHINRLAREQLEAPHNRWVKPWVSKRLQKD